MTADPHAWAHALDTLYDHVWQHLVRGVHDRRAPARHPTLATVSPHGMPKARTVVLRGADKASGRLDIHTHLHSAKVRDIKARPVAALHVWDAGQKLQIRLEAGVECVTGEAAAEAWARVPDAARGVYSAQVPGSPMASPIDHDPHPDAGSFAVLHLHVQAMDILHLGVEHRRAVYQRRDHWVGQWVVP